MRMDFKKVKRIVLIKQFVKIPCVCVLENQNWQLSELLNTMRCKKTKASYVYVIYSACILSYKDVSNKKVTVF